jgi:hypothetical protein
MIFAFVLTAALAVIDSRAQSAPKILWEYKTGG